MHESLEACIFKNAQPKLFKDYVLVFFYLIEFENFEFGWKKTCFQGCLLPQDDPKWVNIHFLKLLVLPIIGD